MKTLDTRATRAPADTDMTLADVAVASSNRFRIARVAGIVALTTALAACNVSPTPTGDAAAPAAGEGIRILDDFDDPSTWTVVTSNQVTGTLRQVDVEGGKALCLDYDYNGVSGHVGIQRDLEMTYPENYRFAFRMRGESPANDLQFKVIDASGDNVWWVNRPKYDFPTDWTDVRYRKRHIDKAWGPEEDKTLRATEKLEFTIYNNAGGKGTVCFDQLTFETLPPDDTSPLTASAASTTTPEGVGNLVDGNAESAWITAAAPQNVVLDLGKVREFGGLRLQWQPGRHASSYAVSLSADGEQWTPVREVTEGNGDVDWLALPEAEARYIGLDLRAGPADGFALAEIAVQPLGMSEHPNDVLEAVAKDRPKGQFPRGFSGEQTYWTILGIDGGLQQGLIGEDGAIEVAAGGFSIEPFVRVGDTLVTWADAKIVQTLQDDYLPIPSVDWTHDALGLRVTGFARGTPEDSQLVARYRLSNPGGEARDYQLALAVRPMQVNPPTQFLNITGGVSPLRQLAVSTDGVRVDGTPRVFARQPAQAAFATTFDAGMDVEHLATGAWPTTTEVEDPQAMASGALVYTVRLAPGESREFDLLIPMTGEMASAPANWNAQSMQDAMAREWHGKLDEVGFDVPAAGKDLADTLRTSLAHMLISRIGPRLQPGTRSYARSWIRDGAMISEGLLRMGRPEVVKDYVEFYAPYQFDNGKVPCCVDDRGSDPVPENDSHGELIFNIAEYWRYTGDDAFLQKMWPHVLGAYTYMEELRASERTEENRKLNAAFYGMMPASISHEGYSAKPMHSYWDNFWALRGYKDAVEIAEALGKPDDAKRMAVARDEFRVDLDASLRKAAEQHGIDFLPGAAELGDFDATSTTIALAPGGEQGRLPEPLLTNTFERYWTQFSGRRDGTLEWKNYTPYEWRNVAAFVRLGWRERATEVREWFFGHRAPQPWNQWGEVVTPTPRVPFFLGDLPHAWVGSDFVRSALDMFAYVREVDDSLVLAAGVPADWLNEGVALRGMRTPQGTVGYSLRREGDALLLDIAADSGLPEGGLVLQWPYESVPGATTIDGQAAQWDGNELRITRAGAKVRIAGAG
ncbi:discoidin domain-containing protein [Luteimonas fraxinea]|uniref:Discoidin domain-containing protein n=1 Tax=Luteimonas fraxinea TaxID=2901869 RepID=A0ABS8UGS3_9GAMM|nr:discoidin domain-containing protein [Luteimonas fraxinea]MCD9098712.1 discoidin domain-containing protein [Luteimonas fraxinea]UHH10371.1 discoidin domain-containing protein [Luteimonas fraxinea]